MIKILKNEIRFAFGHCYFRLNKNKTVLSVTIEPTHRDYDHLKYTVSRIVNHVGIPYQSVEIIDGNNFKIRGMDLEHQVDVPY